MKLSELRDELTDNEDYEIEIGDGVEGENLKIIGIRYDHYNKVVILEAR